MGATVGTARVRSESEDRRQGLAECLPILRAALERGRAFRVEQLTAMTAESRIEGGPAPADAARAEVDTLVADGARRALSDFERALAAMRAGRYGSCEDCGRDISMAILRAVPQTRRCMDCHRDQDGRTDDGSPEAPARHQGGPGARGRAQALPRSDADRRPSRRARTSCSRPSHSGHPVVWVRTLLGRAVTGPQQQHLGHVQDVVARRQGSRAVVTGLVADVGGLEVFVPITAIRELHGPQVIVHALPLGPSWDRRPDELPLARCAIRQPVMTGSGAVHRIADIALRGTPAGWVVWAADTGNVLERLLGSPRRLVPWDVLVGRRLAPGLAAQRGSAHPVPGYPAVTAGTAHGRTHYESDTRPCPGRLP